MPTLSVKTDKDAHVAQDAPDANHGAEAALKVESKELVAAANKRLLCSFDLRRLPAAAVRVVSAKLKLAPSAQAAGRTLRCHEVTGAWTEGGVTWNNQPATGTDHGTQRSDDAPQLWDVGSSVRSRFPGGRPEFRVVDDAEGALVSQSQEYPSRESGGSAPVLEVTYEEQRSARLGSRVTPRQRTASRDLQSGIAVRRTAARFQQSKRVALSAADGAATSPNGIAFDATRDALWVTDQAARKVRRYARATLALEREYGVPDGFQPIGCAYDGVFLWLSDDASSRMTIRKFRIGASTLGEEASFEHDFRTVLAWDGSALWSADPVGGAVYRHRMDATLGVAETFAGLPEVWGLAFTTDAALFTLEKVASGSEGFRIRERRPSDFALLESFAYRGAVDDAPMGLAFAPGRTSGHLVNAEAAGGALLVRPGLDLASTVRPGRIARSADMPSAVKPVNIPGSRDLRSRVRANVPGVGDLVSRLRPRVRRSAVLPSRVRPRERQVEARGQARGIIATLVVVDAQDFLDISAEVGSSIAHTSRGVTRNLRRVVQLVDTRETEAFPRAVTSERGKAGTQDLLRRGDAILYAQGADVFRPGDLVAWQSVAWMVAGVLGFEMVGDVRLYQEVGLRRLAVTVQARLGGEVA